MEARLALSELLAESATNITASAAANTGRTRSTSISPGQVTSRKLSWYP